LRLLDDTSVWTRMMIKPVLAVALLSFTACIMPPQGGAQPAGPSSAPAGGEDESMASSPSSSSSSSSYSSPAPTRASTPAAPAAPTTVSVTIRSSCSKTAKVFYGDKPGFSSGTQSSISSNSVQSKTFRIGDQMWVTDDSGKALDSVRVDAGTRNIEILSSCSSISSR
jgi:hypothetical protein